MHHLESGPVQMGAQKLAKRRRTRRVPQAISDKVEPGGFWFARYQKPIRRSPRTELKNHHTCRRLIDFLNPPFDEGWSDLF